MKPFGKSLCRERGDAGSMSNPKFPIMEERNTVLSFSDFESRYGSRSLCLTEGFALREISASTWSGVPESFARLHSILFVREGSLTMKIGGTTHVLSRNGLSDVPDLTPMVLTSCSADLQAFHLLFTEQFMGDLIRNRPPFPISYMLEITESPVSVVPESVRERFQRGIAAIVGALRSETHHFRPDLVKSAFWMFLLDVADAYMHRVGTRERADLPGHQRGLFLRFMHLLPRHVREEHAVGFYASQLCITPQYLNRIVRRVSGQSVSDTINRVLTGEIMKMLKETELSVQEIADRLSFSDQATLSKFFKRQKGLSPTDYRRQCG